MSDPRPTLEASSESSRTIIASAVRWAIASMIPVVTSEDPGVICTSTALGFWERDPRAEGVNPLGAAVLYQQQRGRLACTSDVDAACFTAVGESARWIEAFSVGVAGLNPPRAWVSHPAGRLMANAYLFGLELYNLAQLAVCPKHPSVRHPKAEECPRCVEAGSDFPTPIDPNAGRAGRL